MGVVMTIITVVVMMVVVVMIVIIMIRKGLHRERGDGGREPQKLP